MHVYDHGTIYNGHPRIGANSILIFKEKYYRMICLHPAERQFKLTCFVMTPDHTPFDDCNHLFLNSTPIHWYSKCQSTIESSTFGSEFVALRVAAEMNDTLRYKLRMLRIDIISEKNGFCDNNSVVQNVTTPESTLNKKHNAIAYHKVRECVAMKALHIYFQRGKYNCSDVLTKFLPSDAHFRCCENILFR
jgi:hypothetical protein